MAVELPMIVGSWRLYETGGGDRFSIDLVSERELDSSARVPRRLRRGGTKRRRAGAIRRSDYRAARAGGLARLQSFAVEVCEPTHWDSECAAVSGAPIRAG